LILSFLFLWAAMYLYILYSDCFEQYYIGITKDVQTRLHFHNTSPKGWTIRGRPWRLVFQKEFDSVEMARHWETWLKRQKSRRIIQEIISGNFDWQR